MTVTSGSRFDAHSSVLRWAGSKRKLLPTLETYWGHQFSRYVEPFAGSAALFFRLRPARALLGDINSSLIETYSVLRDRPDELWEAVSVIPRNERQYYAMRDGRPVPRTALGRAARFVYLNRLCFNGIFRTNLKGEFNVPYAHSRAGSIPPLEIFRRCSAALGGATLTNGDFGAVLSRVRKGDLVYLDPPYAVSTRRIFSEYDKRAFKTTDLDRLDHHLQAIDSRGAHFVVSYADSPEARALLGRWKVKRVRVRRNVAGFASDRRLAVEILATNIIGRAAS